MNPKELYKYLQSSKLTGGPINVTENSRTEQGIIDSFSDPKSFLYELIQNADDAAENGSIRIKITATKDYIFVAHTGLSFTQADVMALCTTGAKRIDPTAKSQDNSKIGYKGVGFKSVFRISNEVSIFSGIYQFQFNQEHWETNGIKTSKELGWDAESLKKWEDYCEHGQQEKKIEFPWRTLPLEVLEEAPAGFENFTVITRIRINDDIKHVDFEAELKKLLADSNVVLFLNSKDLIIETAENKYSRKANEGIVTIMSNGSNESWRLFSSNMKVSKDDLPNNAPPKMKELDQIGITIAINLKNEVVSTIKEYTCDTFSFLPTKENLGLPFLINSQFILDNSREHLVANNEWNKKIFSALGLCLASALELLAKEGVNRKLILNLIPQPIETKEYTKVLLHSFLSKIEKTAFIPVLDCNEPKCIDEVIIDRTGLSAKKELRGLVKKLLNSEEKYIVDNCELEGLSKLDKFKIGFLDEDSICTSFQQERIQEFLKAQDHTYFSSLVEGFKDSAVNTELIKKIPFLKTAKGEIKTPSKLFIVASEADIVYTLEFDLLSSDISKNLNDTLTKWLKEELNIKNVSPESVASKIKKEDLKTKETEIAFFRYLFKNQKKIYNWHTVQELTMITKNGKSKHINDLYLADCYQPIDKVETLLPADLFVSPEYCEQAKDLEKWGQFLNTTLGIKNKIQFEDLQLIKHEKNKVGSYINKEACTNIFLKEFFNYASEVYEQNKQKIKENFTSFPRSPKTKDRICNLQTIPFLTELDNYKFSKYFWARTFKQISENLDGFNDTITADKLRPEFNWFRDPHETPIKLESFSSWIIKNAKVFPSMSGVVMKSSELLLQTEENLLFKDYLNVSALDISAKIREIKHQGEFLFKFRKEPTSVEMLSVLSKLTSEANNVKTLVERIYSHLENSVETVFTGDISKLLTQSDKFLDKNEIVYIQDKPLRKKLNIDEHLYIPNGIKDEKKLIETLGINNTNIEHIDAAKGEKDERLGPYLKEKESLFKCRFPDNDTLSNLSKLKVVAHDRIEVEIKGVRRSINAIIMAPAGDGGILHIDANWQNKRSIRREISEEINKYLKFNNLLMVDDILWTCPLEVIESMENDGIPVSSEVKSSFKSLQARQNTSSIQKNSVLPHIEKTVALENGIHAEKKVFKKLVEIYRDKMPLCKPLTDNEHLFETEEIKIQWQRDFDTAADFDILVSHKSVPVKTIYIEVKSLHNNQFHRDGESLYFSDREWQRMKTTNQKNEFYFLAIVFNNTSFSLSQEDLDLVKMSPQHCSEQPTDFSEVFAQLYSPSIDE